LYLKPSGIAQLTSIFCIYLHLCRLQFIRHHKRALCNCFAAY